MADQNIVDQIMEVLADPMSLPDTFWGYMVQRWIADAPVLPISQVFGFSQWTLQTAARVNTAESTASVTYTDLATVGPSLSSLPDGTYAIFFGCTGLVSASGVSLGQGIKINTTEATDAEAVQIPSVLAGQSGMMLAIKTLSNNNSSSVTCRYRVISGDGVKTLTAGNRWLVALKSANV